MTTFGCKSVTYVHWRACGCNVATVYSRMPALRWHLPYCLADIAINMVYKALDRRSLCVR